MKAIWNEVVLAESEDVIEVEGNYYFPAQALEKQYIESSDHTSFCPWKGAANYYSLNVNGKINKDAIWYYASPKEAASQIKNRVAFWRGVEVI